THRLAIEAAKDPAFARFLAKKREQGESLEDQAKALERDGRVAAALRAESIGAREYVMVQIAAVEGILLAAVRARGVKFEGIGVGSSSAMFSVVDGAVVRPLPYRAPERLNEVISVEGTGQRVPMGAVEFFELERHATTVEAIGAFYPHSATVASPSGPRQAR